MKALHIEDCTSSTPKVSPQETILLDSAYFTQLILGILRQITINDLPVGRSVDEVLRLVKAFQFTDEHGEVCPANWHPGRRTIKPTVTGSKTFFAKTH